MYVNLRAGEGARKRIPWSAGSVAGEQVDMQGADDHVVLRLSSNMQ